MKPSGKSAILNLRDAKRRAGVNCRKRGKIGELMKAAGTEPKISGRHTPGMGLSYVREMDPDTRALIDEAALKMRGSRNVDA